MIDPVILIMGPIISFLVTVSFFAGGYSWIYGMPFIEAVIPITKILSLGILGIALFITAVILGKSVYDRLSTMRNWKKKIKIPHRGPVQVTYYTKNGTPLISGYHQIVYDTFSSPYFECYPNDVLYRHKDIKYIKTRSFFSPFQPNFCYVPVEKAYKKDESVCYQ